MKPLILGGAGFVGQHLAQRLESEGHTVRIYDKRVPRHGSGICADIQDVELLASYMRGHDIVYHLASNADISKSATEPTLDFIEGTQLTQKVLEAMRLSGVKRLVYFSGSGVYGEPKAARLTEDHGPLHPISPYGASKLASEAMISAYCFMFGMEARVFRPANIVGPGQTHGVGYDFLRRLKADPTKLRVLGDGNQTKSYIHIDDVLDAVGIGIESCRRGSVAFDVFNVATDDALSVCLIAEMAAFTAKATNCEISFGTSDRGWNGDVPKISLDCDRLNRIGWFPKYTSAQAMQLALTSMQNEILSQP